VSGAWNLWTEDLTDKQLAMVIESGENPRCTGGFGVELRGYGQWATARSLVKHGLGDIEGGRPNGSDLPGLYFNNEEAVRIIHEFDELDEDEDA
jgi:hypothetical protein